MRIFLDPEYYSVATARDKKVPPSLVIKTSDDFPSYTFDILNTDLQESRTLDIFTYDKIVEAVSGPSLVPSLQASTTGASRNTAGASPASAASSAAVAALAATEAASE
jgi:hypothetical protein